MFSHCSYTKYVTTNIRYVILITKYNLLMSCYQVVNDCHYCAFSYICIELNIFK